MKTFMVRSIGLRLLVPALLALPMVTFTQTVELLWPKGAPDAKDTLPASKPSLTLFPAATAKANGAAVVICPGGGYVNLSMDSEGKEVALFMNTLGVSAFVLKYRLGPTYHHPVEMHDAQRALRWVRANAKRFNIDVDRVGIVGFSAGGHLASTAATHYDTGNAAAPDTIDRFQCRPDFQILGYPVITMDATFTHMGSRTNLLGTIPSADLVILMSNEKQVTSKTPPAFIFHSQDDNVVPIKNSQSYYDALVKAGVPAQYKIFDHGGHGYGMANGVAGTPNDPVLAVWPSLAAKWMQDRGLFQKATSLASARPAAPGFSGPHARGGYDFLGRLRHLARGVL